MLKFFISIFPMFVFAQANLESEAQTKAYCQVIAEYIKVTAENSKLNFDTLYIGKHVEFPNITLPQIIQNKKIILLTDKKGDKDPENNKSFILINIIESKLTKYKAEFMLVTFYKYHPQHNCYIHLKFNSTRKEFELDGKIRFEYTYPKNN